MSTVVHQHPAQHNKFQGSAHAMRTPASHPKRTTSSKKARPLTADEWVAMATAQHQAAKAIAETARRTLQGAQWVKRLTDNLAPPSKGWHQAMALADAAGGRGHLADHRIPATLLQGIPAPMPG